jgi:predicted TIM-barrel fold metal-dependent hydrolase
MGDPAGAKNGAAPVTGGADRPADGRSLVVDIDAHYFEKPREFARYLDEAWKRRIESWASNFFASESAKSGSADATSGGRIMHSVAGPGHQLDSREGVLNVMGYLGVDVVVLVPGTLLGMGEITDKRRANALCRGYIEYMLDQACDPARGIYTVIMAPNQSPPDGAELIDRMAGEDGVCGVGMMTDGPILPLGDSYYDPIYDACVRHRLPLVLHSGYGGPEGTESGYGLQTYVENHAFAFVANNQKHLVSMVMQGVFERFPDLRVVIEEAGVFWIPQTMFRLDSEYAIRRPHTPWLTMPPSDYIRRNCFFGTQPLEIVPRVEYLKYVFEMIDGERCLMFATDWPHGDFDNPVAIERLPFLSEQGKRAILGDNARRVLRFRGLGRSDGEMAGGKALHGVPDRA